MNDKKLEMQRKILDLIYKNVPRLMIQEYDKPDFRLKYKGHNNYFGVEVTEFYFNETSARLRNVAGYLNDLLTTKKFIHKRDRKNLKVQKVTIISKSGENKGEPEAVIHELPSLASCRHKISLLIGEKNNRFSKYDKTLHHINLIIHDAEGFLFGIKRKDFYNTVYSSDIVKSIINSYFREIYFITRAEGNKCIYFPLKMILFISRIYAFAFFVRQEYPSKKGFDEEEYYRYLIEYLDCLGFRDIKIVKSQNKTGEIVYGNIGFCIEEEKKVVLKEYQDYELPSEAEPINIKEYYHLSEKNIETIRNINEAISFETEIGYEVK